MGSPRFPYPDLKAHTPDMESDADGTLWIFAGADSGFEGRTSLFFTQASIHIRPAPADEDENSNNDNDSPSCDHQHL